MPYYQKKGYVFEAINSVLRQTYSKFELIIIFDDSDEEIFDKIYELAKLDKRIKLIQNDKNLGAGLSRNVGINHSKGVYIAFLDSDDLWYKNKLLAQIKFILNSVQKFDENSKK